jgi:hypothetical protein
MPSNGKEIHMQIHRLMGWIYEIRRSDRLKHQVTKSYKDCFMY